MTEEVSTTPESAYENEEVTQASNEWLKNTGSKIKRWIGHGVRFVGSEMAINLGTGFATFGVLGSILTGNPIPLLLTAGGSALAGAGVAVEWNSMKHAESETEKSAFLLSKVGQTVGTGALTTLSALGAPALLPVATGMYLAGVGMGGVAMTHRK
jgi:hypothetical protein